MEDGQFIEIKKYNSDHVKEWTLYSEPIFKIASRSTLEKVADLFGDGDLDKALAKLIKIASMVHGQIF